MNYKIKVTNYVLPLISRHLPLLDIIAKRAFEFSRKCLCSDSRLMSFVARHGLLSVQMNSSFARNVFNCCRNFNLHTYNLSLLLIISGLDCIIS